MTIRIAVDVMGGDNAPDAVLEGCEQALAEMPELQLLVCGPAETVEPFAAAHERCEAHVASELIGMGEHPATAVRKKKDSSLVVGCRLVKEGRADGFFSAGSTGACLAAAILVMGRIKGVQRPALAVVLPTPERESLLLDVGANADVKASYILQFAQMGTVFMNRVCGVADPRVRLLNIGGEEAKGSALVQESYGLLAEALPNFDGNAEGGDVLGGVADVIVTDGFTGNVALKSIEGTVKLVFGQIKDILKGSTKTKLAALAIKPQLKQLASRLDPDAYGGSPLLGVRGACIVGHGSSNARAVKNGIATTARFVRLGLVDELEAAIGEGALAAAAADECPDAAGEAGE